MSLSTSDFRRRWIPPAKLQARRSTIAGDRELRTLVPLTLEVERNRNAATFAAQVPGHQYRPARLFTAGFALPRSMYSRPLSGRLASSFVEIRVRGEIGLILPIV